MHNQSIRHPGAWVGLLVFENLKTMMNAPMRIEGKGAIAEVCFLGWRIPPYPPHIIYPSFSHHLCSRTTHIHRHRVHSSQKREGWGTVRR